MHARRAFLCFSSARQKLRKTRQECSTLGCIACRYDCMASLSRAVVQHYCMRQKHTLPRAGLVSCNVHVVCAIVDVSHNKSVQQLMSTSHLHVTVLQALVGTLMQGCNRTPHCCLSMLTSSLMLCSPSCSTGALLWQLLACILRKTLDFGPQAEAKLFQALSTHACTYSVQHLVLHLCRDWKGCHREL